MASKDPDEKCSNTKTGDETIAYKMRSKSRRVSFAETTAIHLFIRDDECDTPPENEGCNNLQRTVSDEIRELLVDDSDDVNDDNGVSSLLETPFLRPFESPSSGSYFGSATSNDEENFFGPVSADFIKPGRLSDSAASDENHDITMDSTAFSMHFRSLARSDSGGEFKTPTSVPLAFGERTSGQTSATASEDSMVLSASRKRVPDSMHVNSVSDSGNSDDMTIVEENHHRYDYGKLPPELDALLAEDDKDMGAVSLASQFECSNLDKSFKADSASDLNNNGLKSLDVNNTDKVSDHVSDVKTSDGAISAVHLDIDNGNDGILHSTLGETTRNTSINIDDDDLLPVTLSGDQSKSPILLTNVMPVDKDDDTRKSSGKFLSPLSSSQSNLNHGQPIVGSVSSLLAKRRQLFRATPIDKSNLSVLGKTSRDRGSNLVLTASSIDTGVSRPERLEAFPFFSASKAEGISSKLMHPESFTSSSTRNNVLNYGSKDDLVEHLAVPVACLDKEFSNVAERDRESQIMGNMGKYDLKITLGDAQFARYLEAKATALPSLYPTLCSDDLSIKSTSIGVSPLAHSKEKRLEPFVLPNDNTKEIVMSTESDCSLLEITSNDLKNKKEPSRSDFSSENSAEKKVSASPLYQGSISKKLKQQTKFRSKVDRNIIQETNDLASRTENSSSLLPERKKEVGRSSPNVKHSVTVPHDMQNDESNYFQAALMDKASESCKLIVTRANVETATLLARACPLKNVKSVIGSAPTLDYNLIELPMPTQVSENHNEDLSCSLLQKKPCLADDAIVGITVSTPRSYPLTSKQDENDQPLISSNVYGSDSSSCLKRKLFDKAVDDDDEIASFQHKPKLCKGQEHYEGDSKIAHSEGGDATAKVWDDVLNSIHGMNDLLPSLIGKLDLTQIRKLNDILAHLDKMKSYELLHRDICSQKAFDSARFLQMKRFVDTKLLLYKTVNQKAKLQVMRLERDKLLDLVHQLDSRVEDSKMLILSCQGSCIRDQKDVEVDCLPPVSCPINYSKTSLAVSDIPSLRRDLDVSKRKIRKLNKSYQTYIKVIKEPSCTETIVLVKKFLRKRVACKSLQSEHQICQVGSVKATNGQLNVLFDYGGIMSQRFVAKSISAYGLSVSNLLNNVKISKIFIGMNACTAFSFVLCDETNVAYSGIQAIAQETQKSSSLLHTLLDVVEEAELAMIELKRLTNIRFSQPSAGKLDLRLCFTDFNSSARVALSIDVTCLNRGIYPSEAVPYEVQGKVARRQESLQLLIDNIKSAVCGIRCGQMRIISLCRCVSRIIQANSIS